MKNEVNRALVAKKKLTILFVLLTLSVGLWAATSVITFTSTGKLYPVDIFELDDDFTRGDDTKWEAFKAQYPEFKDVMSPAELSWITFNPNAFLDANNQVLTFTIDYDESTHAGTITVNGELVKIARDAFVECTALTSITLPEGVTSIGGSAFSDCTALTSVILPESLSSIGIYGFDGCPLSSVTIPANVTYLGYRALGSNSSLTDVYVAWTTTLPTLEENATFNDSPIDKVTLHVPDGTKMLYQAAAVWNTFGTFIELAEYKAAAIAEITTAREGIQNTNLNNWIDAAIDDIQKGGPDATPGIDEIKEEILNIISFFKDGKAEGYTEGETAGDAAGYARGKAEGIEEGDAAGYERAKAELPTDPEGTAGHTVTITKGDKTLILVNPDKVTYGKQE